jgi:hypothetical protein
MYIGLHVSYCYCCQIMKLEFFGQALEIYSNTKFYKNLSSGSRVVPCGRTDKHDKDISRLSQFCERAKKRTTQTSALYMKGHIKTHTLRS